MNFTVASFDWNQVRAFLATAETGTLSAAARSLGLTQPTVGRQVAALEETLGLVLFDRVGRSLTLTPVGRDLLDRVRLMGEAAEAVALAATGHSQTVEGEVVISASDAISAYLLPEVVAGLRRKAPGIDVEILSSNDLSDLRRREADIAIRHVRPNEPELVAKLVRSTEARLYAAPGWIRRHGRPERPEDLADATVIALARSERMVETLAEHGLPIRSDQIRLVSGNSVVAWELVRAGLGITVMSDDIAARTGGVERILPSFRPIPVPVWLVTRAELHRNPRIRLVFDHLAEALAR